MSQEIKQDDFDVCTICGAKDGQPHSDRLHGSGRYGVGGDLELKGEDLKKFLEG
jgi:hypothetical protein